MKNYINKEAVVLNNIYDEDENEILLYENDIVTITDTEVELDGFGSDYVNVITEDGEEIIGISSYDLELLDD